MLSSLATREWLVTRPLAKVICKGNSHLYLIFLRDACEMLMHTFLSSLPATLSMHPLAVNSFQINVQVHECEMSSVGNLRHVHLWENAASPLHMVRKNMIHKFIHLLDIIGHLACSLSLSFLFLSTQWHGTQEEAQGVTARKRARAFDQC